MKKIKKQKKINRLNNLHNRIYMYIFFVVSFLIGIAFLSYSAYVDLEICKLNPSYTYNSVYIKFVLGL